DQHGDVRLSPTRGRIVALVVAITSATAALFHMYSAGVSPFTALVQRPIHLALMAILGFLGVGVQKSAVADGRSTLLSRASGVLGWVLAGLTVAGCVYLALENQELVARAGNPTTMDLVWGGITIVLVLELARRATGWGLVSICVLALAYGLAGPYLPGILAHRGYPVRRLVEHIYLSTEGIWGVPLGVSADFVYLFVLFGAVLEVAGGGAL